ncbi:hypothetical protein GGR50DRAFT_402271 [Xylaria sp. CBS 124048]|nr:hypothetical protein GGR50DRAFT_402271 [Xylaria sp. CBS 124048]
MLEYFTYKKVKKHREEKTANKQIEKGKQIAKQETTTTTPIASNSGSDGVAAAGAPVLDREDEEFLEHLTSSNGSIGADDDDIPPPLPPRVKTPIIEIDSESSSISGQKEEGKEKQKEKEKDQAPPAKNRFSFVKALPRSISLRRKPATSHQQDHLSVPEGTKHGDSEDAKLVSVLDDLDLVSRNNRAISLSAESASLARSFTQILRDLVNGVPTAYGDLTSLLDNSDGILARNYERLPRSLKKLVAQLPEKLTSTLAPELLAVAAEAHGIEAEEKGVQDTAKRLFTPANLRDLVTKPGALVSLLKGIMNALKTRFPAFVGTNVLWSLAVFLLLSMLWYCHKRGREVRLEREARAKAEAEGMEVGETSTAGAEGALDHLQASGIDRNTPS